MAARILVVDDSSTIRKVVCSILDRHGFDVVPAADGASALDILSRGEGEERQKFDLILLDFIMPRMNGFQFCRALRNREDLRKMPVLLMSAKSERIREQFVQQTGAVDAITKPFDAQALVAVIEGALTKPAEGRARPVPEGAKMPDENTIGESRRPAQLAKQHRQKTAIDVAQRVAHAVTPV